jgi:hypothetical protein
MLGSAARFLDNEFAVDRATVGANSFLPRY